MSDLRELYQEVILHHQKKPRNFHEMPDATRQLEGYNPLCGDHYTIFLKQDGDHVQELSFQGDGCAISKASASMMTDSLKGKTVDEARAYFRLFQKLIIGSLSHEQAQEHLGKLAVFAGVREFPARVKCAMLAWHTANAILEGEEKPVTTE